MLDQNTVIGRGLAQIDPVLYRSISDRITPMLKDTIHIPQIIEYIKRSYDDYEQYMINLLCVGAIYDIYCPGSFMSKSVMKASIGIRDAVSNAMGYNSPEMVNYFHVRSVPFLKFRNKEFGLRVDAIKDAFKHLSVRKLDWELELI